MLRNPLDTEMKSKESFAVMEAKYTRLKLEKNNLDPSSNPCNQSHENVMMSDQEIEYQLGQHITSVKNLRESKEGSVSNDSCLPNIKQNDTARLTPNQILMQTYKNRKMKLQKKFNRIANQQSGAISAAKKKKGSVKKSSVESKTLQVNKDGARRNLNQSEVSNLPRLESAQQLGN